jgi:hypothetical protein
LLLEVESIKISPNHIQVKENNYIDSRNPISYSSKSFMSSPVILSHFLVNGEFDKITTTMRYCCNSCCLLYDFVNHHINNVIFFYLQNAAVINTLVTHYNFGKASIINYLLKIKIKVSFK